MQRPSREGAWSSEEREAIEAAGVSQPEPRSKGGLGGCRAEEVLILILWHIEIPLPGGAGKSH